MTRRPLLVILLLPFAISCAGSRGAGPSAAAPPFPPPHTEEELDRRLAFLTERLDDGRLHAAAWSWGWLGVQGFGVGSGVAGAVNEDDSGDRARNIVDAAKSAVGVADLLVLRPMPVRAGAKPLRSMPSATFAEKRAQLLRAEEILLSAESRARQRRSWVTHLGNLGFNLAGSAVLLGLGHGQAAWITLATGFVGGEAQIWSEPWRAPRDVEDYRRLIAAESPVAREPAPAFRGGVAGSGLALELRF